MMPASVSLLAFTITMKRMTVLRSNLCCRAPLWPALVHKDEPPFAAQTSGKELFARLLTSIVDRLIGKRPEVGHDGRHLRRFHHPLGEQDAGQIFLRVRVPGGAKTAFPAVAAGHIAQLVAPGEDGDTKTPAAVVAKEQLLPALLLGREMVRRHQFDR